jgi:hypothetical protein
MREDEKGVACDARGNGGNCIQILVPRLGSGAHMEDQGVDGKIILKLNLMKWGERHGLCCCGLGIGTSDCPLFNRFCNVGFNKMLGGGVYIE